MKKSIIYSLSLIFSILFIAACVNPNKYDLRYNLQKGDSFIQTVDMDMTSSVMGHEVKITMNASVGMDVVDIQDGIYQISTAYRSMKMSSESETMQMRFDTENPDAYPQSAAFSRIMQAMVNVPFDVEMDRQGKVVEISGFENLQKAIIDAAAGSAEEMSKQIAMQMSEQQFSEEQLKEMFSQFRNIYPVHPIKIGDSWEATDSRNMNGMELAMTAKYTLQAVEGNIATVAVSGKFDAQSSAISTAQGDISTTIDGHLSGTTNINLENGMAIAGNLLTSIDATMDIGGRNVEQKTVVKMQLKSE
ncbi:MAG: DUF6263 family protein [Prevotellaceae bacterium]|jgi:hypothetical protein|nr:DUF6263 family protein [Prevotellaceae bacterium]